MGGDSGSGEGLGECGEVSGVGRKENSILCLALTWLLVIFKCNTSTDHR